MFRNSLPTFNLWATCCEKPQTGKIVDEMNINTKFLVYRNIVNKSIMNFKFLFAFAVVVGLFALSSAYPNPEPAPEPEPEPMPDPKVRWKHVSWNMLIKIKCWSSHINGYFAIYSIWRHQMHFSCFPFEITAKLNKIKS